MAKTKYLNFFTEIQLYLYTAIFSPILRKKTILPILQKLDSKYLYRVMSVMLHSEQNSPYPLLRVIVSQPQYQPIVKHVLQSLIVLGLLVPLHHDHPMVPLAVDIPVDLLLLFRIIFLLMNLKVKKFF